MKFTQKFDDDNIDPILPKTLKCIIIPLIERESCCEDYKDRYVITPRMSCYGYQDGAEDACKVRLKLSYNFCYTK